MVELLRVGCRVHDFEITQAVLEQLAKTDPLPPYTSPPDLGHTRAIGNVKRLWVDGSALFAELDVPPLGPVIPTIAIDAKDPVTGDVLGPRILSVYRNDDPIAGAGGKPL